MERKEISSGITALDEILNGIRFSDNVVWQVEQPGDYRYFAEPFVKSVVSGGIRCIYMRFSSDPPVLSKEHGVVVAKVNPGEGFDSFSRQVHEIVEREGKGICYVFDNLSSLVETWATDELLANFFRITCPFLYDQQTVAYFSLTRGRHSHGAVAKIRDTTQILIDVFHANGAMYIQPLKVWDRYSPQMFLPYTVFPDGIKPVFRSGEAAAVSSIAHTYPLKGAERSVAPWESVYGKLLRYREEGFDEKNQELAALKREFSRMIFGEHPEFNRLSGLYINSDDLIAIRNRLIGSGRIGGKSAGMLLARKILLSEKGGEDYFRGRIEPHDSFYIGSDVFFTFLVDNDLFKLRLRAVASGSVSREEFAVIEEKFLKGAFPGHIMEQFRNILDYFGQSPIIVRSSSLLEDSFGNAFAGKYRSEFCANQGAFEERMEVFLNAVKLVYASTLNPDALSYRAKRDLAASEEQMAILVQRVSGMPYGNYFFPSLAGVAFSRNIYNWNKKIDPKKGMIRLVFGLGTRAVDRTAGDYARMIPVSNPQLRPEIGEKVVKYSQKQVDMLDIAKNRFETAEVNELLSAGDYPYMNLFVSMLKEGGLYDSATGYMENYGGKTVLTFNNLIKDTDMIEVIDAVLTKLEEGYGHPVEIEFTAALYPGNRVKVNLLQCRPLFLPGTAVSVIIPESIDRKLVLFRSDKMVYGGQISNIKYIVYVDSGKYGGISSAVIKKSLGRLVGRINNHPALSGEKIMLMGPGRWGSSNVDLGVNATYADISNASVLVEVAQEKSGHIPEISFGTHFFQDLVENRIIFIAVYPEEANTAFNGKFFNGAENSLPLLLPEDKEFAGYVKVIDVPSAAGGMYAQVAVNPEQQKAVCYLSTPV